MTVRILHGDCREVLKTLPSDSVHCCVTSPPYWSLRDYGCAGQIGLESTFTEFISEMVGVFREVRRVLRPDGTLWLNLGDSYASGEIGRHDGYNIPTEGRTHTTNKPFGGRKQAKLSTGLKPKDLCGIPWRVALALQEDGWWLRSEIIWSKPNPMPESVTDRPTKAHEQLFLLAKSPRYYYDAEAIKEAQSEGTFERFGNGKAPRQINAKSKTAAAGEVLANSDYKARTPDAILPDGRRNKRSVWEIATSPFPEAHFATFPPALVEPCIKAGTSEKGCCGKCGAPWVRETKATFVRQQDVNAEDGVRGAAEQKPMDASNGWQGFPRGTTSRETLGWSPTCTCQAPVIPCTVLDPFGGAGTTGLVADRLQRNGILIELNPEYAAMAEKRIIGDAPLLAGAL